MREVLVGRKEQRNGYEKHSWRHLFQLLERYITEKKRSHSFPIKCAIYKREKYGLKQAEGKYNPERNIALHSMSLTCGTHQGTRSASCSTFLHREADHGKPAVGPFIW